MDIFALFMVLGECFNHWEWYLLYICHRCSLLSWVRFLLWPLSKEFLPEVAVEFCQKIFSTSIEMIQSPQSLSCVQFFVTPWTAAHQASLSITNSWSLLKLMSTKLVMPSNHLILCHPLLLLTSIIPRIRVFSNESVLHIWWPKYWSFNFRISPLTEYSGLISFRID